LNSARLDEAERIAVERVVGARQVWPLGPNRFLALCFKIARSFFGQPRLLFKPCEHLPNTLSRHTKPHPDRMLRKSRRPQPPHMLTPRRPIIFIPPHTHVRMQPATMSREMVSGSMGSFGYWPPAAADTRFSARFRPAATPVQKMAAPVQEIAGCNRGWGDARVGCNWLRGRRYFGGTYRRGRPPPPVQPAPRGHPPTPTHRGAQAAAPGSTAASTSTSTSTSIESQSRNQSRVGVCELTSPRQPPAARCPVEFAGERSTSETTTMRQAAKFAGANLPPHAARTDVPDC
jgi:hypothetical protein